MPAPGDAVPTDPAVTDNTGAARFRVPIELPPGPGGFAPDVALRYSSRSGDGALGIGWSLGIPEIHCSGRFGVQDLAACASFELAGQPLVAHPTIANRYHTFVESFQRIEYHPSGRWWSVDRTDGTTLFFGTTSAHRVAQGGAPARWLLERMEDAFGNAIHFTWDTTSDPGSAYLVSISYGAGAAAGTGPRQVVFLYESRPDPQLVFSAGLARSFTLRLREIQVLGHGYLARRYALRYAAPGEYATDRSRLEAIQEFGSDCTAADTASCTGLPPTTLAYRDAGDLPSQAAFGQWSENDAHRIPLGIYPVEHEWNRSAGLSQLIGDLNGDGLPDRLEVHPAAQHLWGLSTQDAVVRVWINTGTGFHGTGDESVWADAAAAFAASFDGLTYEGLRLDYAQIPVPEGYGRGIYQGQEMESLWMAGSWPEAGYYAMCSVSDPVPEPDRSLAADLNERGLLARTRYASTLAGARVGSPVDGFLRPLPGIRLADLDSDGRADLIVSTRLGRVARHFDCDGNPVPASWTSDATITAVFRNTGSGWVRDPALSRGMPPFEELAVKSSYQASVDHPNAPWINGSGPGPFVLYGEAWNPCATLGVFGFEQTPLSDGSQRVQASVCYAPIDLAPRFQDFDGDGYLDVAVLQRDRPDQLLTGTTWFAETANPARTVVWLQDPRPGAAARWVRAPRYDLPAGLVEAARPGTQPLHSLFAHVVLASEPQSWTLGCWSWDDNFPWCAPTMHRLDLGVRFADVNRDGLTDVVWSGPNGEAVLLNTGLRSGAGSSAWCISNGDPAQVDLVGGSCPEAARYLPPLPIAQADPGGSISGKGHFADLNGDGWLDYIWIDAFYVDALQSAAFLFAGRDDGDAEGYWERDGRFDLPFDRPWSKAPHPLPGGAPQLCFHGYDCGIADRPPAKSGFAVIDVNGDGADDVIGDFQAFLSQSHHGDLLSEIDNGRGGAIALDYQSAVGQRDAALEQLAAEDGPGAGDALLWRPSPVVSRVTVTAPDFAPAVTRYRYARPGFCPEWRSEEGFRLIETERPDASRVREIFYQDHGRAGRTLERVVIDGGEVVHRYRATWEHVGAVVPGSMAGVFHARLEWEQSGNEFSGLPGATVLRTLSYDDLHGYDFASQIETERPTGILLERRVPFSDTASHVMGRIARRTLLDGADAVLRDTRYVYYGIDGAPTAPRVGRVLEWIADRDDPTSASWVQATAFRYDPYGNVVEERTPSPTGVGVRTTHHCYDGDSAGPCWSPSGQLSHSVRVVTIDPLDGAIVTIPDPARGVPLQIGSSYTDEPGTRLVLDGFGRPVAELATPEGGPEVLLAETTYHDDVGAPLWIERFAYTDEFQGDFVYTGTVFGAFGTTWKKIEQTANDNYVGVVSWRDFAARVERVTLPVDCAGDPRCAGAGGQSEAAARQVTADTLGRSVRVDTPEGFSVLRHSPAPGRGHPAGLGGPGPFDAVLVKNGKGDLTQRVTDGDRTVWVDECHTGVDPQLSSLDQATCGFPSGADTTLYTYEATGEVRAVYDATAVRTHSYGDPDHRLRYRYDTLGRVVRIEDPDLEGTGFQTTTYDAAGLITSTTNARGQQRTFAYDDLARRVGITTPEGEDDYTVTYRAGERKRHGDSSKAYQRARYYDAWGRLERTRLTVAETNGGPFWMDYVYDLAGRLIEQVHPESTRIRWEYEGASLVRVCDVGEASTCSGSGSVPVVSAVVYDALGRRRQTHLGAGTRTFDYVGSTERLAGDRFEGPSTAVDPYSYRLDYVSYDGVGNPTYVTGSSRYGDIDLNESYEYDHRNRIATWTKGGVSLDYRYDELGNLTLHAGEVQRFADPGRPHAITERAAEGVRYGHDDDGNVTSIIGGGSARHLTFDSANRLVCVDTANPGGCGTTRIHYDVDGVMVLDDLPAALGYTVYVAGGTRVEGAVPRRVRIEIGAFGERVALKRSTAPIRNATGNAAPGEPPHGVWAALLAAGFAGLLLGAIRCGVPAASVIRPIRCGTSVALAALLVLSPLPPPVRAGGGSGSVLLWELVDRLGTGIAMVDAAGQRVVHRTFAPFGRVHASTSGADWIPRHYAGHAWQSHIGLYAMQARTMDPASGMFLSVDPLVPGGSDPQSLNAYAYARNNPVRLGDPTGGLPLDELQSCNRCSGFYSPGYATLGDGSIVTAGQISVQNHLEAKAYRDAGLGDLPGPTDILAGIGLFLKGAVDLVIGENFGAAWRSLFAEWVEVPTKGQFLPKGMVEAIDRARAALPANARQNGMHSWHAAANAALARALGLVGAPVIFVIGFLHETPIDYGSFMAEQRWQGSVNHLLDSTTDIGANAFGLVLGYAIPRTSWAIDTAAALGNHIPGPGEPDPAFGGMGGPYRGDPSAAWGQYP